MKKQSQYYHNMLSTKTYIFIILFAALLTVKSYAQSDCIVNLNEAERLYSQGQIEKIPSLLNGCIESGFSKENKINALRLLTLVYLFEDNQVKAEKTLLRLLKTDPEFKINRAIDPLEFINLYNSYNTAPVFSLGLSSGINNTFPRLLETFSHNSFKDANPKYTSNGIGVNLGFSTTYHINSKMDMSFVPSFSILSYGLTENVSSANTMQMTENLNYLELPIYGGYTFYKYQIFDFFGELGFQYSLLLSSTINKPTFLFNNNDYPSTPGSSINSKAIRNSKNIFTSMGVGTKIKLNRSNLKLSLRYKFGYFNLTNPNTRFDDHGYLSSEYLFIDNDFAVSNFSITICYSREFYIHKKKPDNRTNYEIIK